MISGNQVESECTQDWCADELQGVSLGDKRLDWRLIDTTAKLAACPQGTINQACDDWADTKAAYRLFDNQKTTAAKILSPHGKRTRERVAEHELVLAVQDTTYLNYSHHPGKQGVGPLAHADQAHIRGLVMHSVLMMTPAGLPLGVTSQRIWARDAEAKQWDADERRKLPIEDKESYKWLVALDDTMTLAPDTPQIVTVGDSEADIFELVHHAVQTLQTDLLIRAGQDRSLVEPETGRIWSVMSQRPVAGHLRVHVPRQKQRPKRDAIVSVRYAQVVLKAPRHLRSRMADLPVYALLVQEEKPDDDVEALSWLLLTTVPVLCMDDAVERVQWYRQRWQIEVYHKILKSGCQVEKAQLANTQRLLPLLAVYTIIAWRLFWITHLARQEPDAPCTTILTTHEWHALYAYTHKSNRVPTQVPTTHQALLWIAQLGGFLARRHDGEPGVTVIWRGWQRLTDIASSWLIFHPQDTCG